MENIGTNCFYIVLVDDICDDNFSDCINQDNQLKYSNNHYVSAECELKHEVNGEVESIILNEDCTFTFDGEGTNPESFNMKGAFLTTDSGYVMGYSINQYSINITTQMIFEKGLIFYDIIEGSGIDGE